MLDGSSIDTLSRTRTLCRVFRYLANPNQWVMLAMDCRSLDISFSILPWQEQLSRSAFININEDPCNFHAAAPLLKASRPASESSSTSRSAYGREKNFYSRSQRTVNGVEFAQSMKTTLFQMVIVLTHGVSPSPTVAKFHQQIFNYQNCVVTSG